MTICSKFGIRGFCVAADVGIGERVAVNAAVAETGKTLGVSDNTGVDGAVSILEQAVSNNRIRQQKPERFIRFPLDNALH